MCRRLYSFFFFFFNDTATTEIYTLSLHDALPICDRPPPPRRCAAMNVAVCIKHVPDTEAPIRVRADGRGVEESGDRKSTRLNSSHSQISYAVFCLKKKKKKKNHTRHTYRSKRQHS